MRRGVRVGMGAAIVVMSTDPESVCVENFAQKKRKQNACKASVRDNTGDLIIRTRTAIGPMYCMGPLNVKVHALI